MPNLTIPWGDGSGDNIYLTYDASQGDQIVLVASDANNGAARQKEITFVSAVGNISRKLTVSQESGMDLVFITYNDVCITYNDVAIGYPVETLNYVQDGLVLWLDGIDKGEENNAWVDKINGHSFINNGAIFNPDHIYLDGASFLQNSSFDGISAGVGTIEVVCEFENFASTSVLFMGKSGCLSLGVYQQRYCWSAGVSYATYGGGSAAAGSISISGARALRNGLALTASSADNWTGPNPYNWIGRRNSGSYFKGKVYCIRIYNRQLTMDEVMANLSIDNARFNLGLTV